ncbi:MAG: hypothetical protein Q9227_003486 [Pyrenula ochraceoflavens]
MEVFSKYFRRLVTGNASQIFPGTFTKSSENAGNYPILVEEMRKVVRDPTQATKIAESIDGGDGEVFRDFDLITFIEHFKLSAISQTLLALAFLESTKSELRSKAETLLKDIAPTLFQELATPPEASQNNPPHIVALLIERIACTQPRPFNAEATGSLELATAHGYHTMNIEIPSAVASALQLLKLPEGNLRLLQRLYRAGPSVTSSKESAEDLLRSLGSEALNEAEVAFGILFTVFSLNASLYKTSNLVAALRSRGASMIEWTQVVQGFDQPGIQVTSEHFVTLYGALLPIAHDDHTFDIQRLWSGQWQNVETLISFLGAFLLADPADLNVDQIPGLRRGFDIELFSGAPDAILKQAEEAIRSPFASQDAVAAVFEHVVIPRTSGNIVLEAQKLLRAISEHHLASFLICALSLPKPWADDMMSYLRMSFMIFFIKQNEAYHFALEAAWRQDREWTFGQLCQAFNADPLTTNLILEHADEHGWTEEILGVLTPLSADLACLLQKIGRGDIEGWVRAIADHPQADMGMFLSKYLRVKAEDEVRVQKGEQPTPLSVSLDIKSVFTLIETAGEYLSDDQALILLQRLCLTGYPRLANYDQGRDDVIEANGREGNQLSRSIEEEMQQLFMQMLSSQITLHNLLNLMRQYKFSDDAQYQEYFACMVRILFEEYNAFDEYPPDALAKTAAMFGAIINYKLIDGIPLKVGLGMILEAVREEQNSTFYKFGVEAIEQLTNRLPEWTLWCRQLMEIPGLKDTDVLKAAESVLQENGDAPEQMTNGTIGLTVRGAADQPLTNGIDELVGEDSALDFRSLHVDLPARGIFRDPDEVESDKASFILNNLSEQNLTTKLPDLADVLKEEHFQWFASCLVEQRAKLEPNFQELYLKLLSRMNNKLLWSEVLRETYVSSIRMLNADSTIKSATERAHLKNLGGWLGSLTLAKDKPIRHKNIFFRGLLMEGYDTGRLVVVIPFTCKVLVQARSSTVFRPPNPWLMELLALLMELYHHAELKLNLKFEIEVLCKDLDVDCNAIEPAEQIRARQVAQFDETGPAPGIPDTGEGFEDLSLPGVARAVPNERLSPVALMTSLPPLEQTLVFPPINNTLLDSSHIHQSIMAAFRRAIHDIIAPVVERSIAIASMSTTALISKDFATEGDDEKLRAAAYKLVKSLSGSLALVTCKEPLKMSITNFLRRPDDASEPVLPDGLILMCVNDNIDWACSFIEGVAEEKSIAEVNVRIESEISRRRQWRSLHPNEPFIAAEATRYAEFLPEPYRQTMGGLNMQQLAVYDNFARQERGLSTNHTQNVSTDSTGRQMPDILQEPFSNLPNLTPAEPPAVPQQTPHMHQGNQMLPSGPPQVNGYSEPPEERIQTLFSQLQRAARDSSVDRVSELSRESSIVNDFQEIQRIVGGQTRVGGEGLAWSLARQICFALFGDPHSPLEMEVMARLLARTCVLSEAITRDVYKFLLNQEESYISKPTLTMALLDASLIDFTRIDTILAKSISSRQEEALKLLSDLLYRYIFKNEQPVFRAQFASSIEAMIKWLAETPDLAIAKDLYQKLKEPEVPLEADLISSDRLNIRQDQMEYLFEEWVVLYTNTVNGNKSAEAFLREVFDKHVITSFEDSALFFRFCVESCIEGFEMELHSPNANFDSAMLRTDALARLIILLVKLHGDNNGRPRIRKPSYLNSILSIIVLVQNHHHVTKGENFNQRVFFRLFSSILSEYSVHALQHMPDHRDMMLVIADTFRTLQPSLMPGFAYAWFGLISHRLFVSHMLKLDFNGGKSEGERSYGWQPYCRLVQIMLRYTGNMLKLPQIPQSARDLYQAVSRVLVMLHHDYPDFVAANHFHLCNAIPAHCTQFRNLVLMASPQTLGDLPDPFAGGLKPDRLVEMQNNPVIAGDIDQYLQRGGVQDVIDQCLRTSGISEAAIAQVCSVVNSPIVKQSDFMCQPIEVDTVLLHALVLHVAQDAIASSQRNEPGNGAFKAESVHTALFDHLARALSPEGRYYLFHAMANQLRYPNTHTHYFCCTLLHLFGSDRTDQSDSDIRHQIVQIVLERMIVDRPHPWGLVILLLEFDQNRTLRFWDLPFNAAAPESKRANTLAILISLFVANLSLFSGFKGNDKQEMAWFLHLPNELLFLLRSGHLRQKFVCMGAWISATTPITFSLRNDWNVEFEFSCCIAMASSDSASSSADEPQSQGFLWSAARKIFAPVISLSSVLTSKSALKAYLTSILFGLASLVLIGISTFAYIFLYYQYVPQIGLERVVHFQFSDSQNPQSVVALATSNSPTPLISGQSYDVTLSLHLPRTPTNLALGNFMLDVKLLSQQSGPSALSGSSTLSMLTSNTSTTLAHSRRPAILTYTSSPVGHFSTLLSLPWYTLGIIPLHRLESEMLIVPMFEQEIFQRGKRNVPAMAKVEIIPPAVSTGSGCTGGSQMQIYDARISFRARFSGLRWLMYNHRIISFTIFTSGFYTVAIVSMSIAWLAISLIFRKEQATGKPQNSAHADGSVMKNEEGIESATRIKKEDNEDESDSPLSVSNLSDNPTTFPTLSRQMPLRFPVPQASSKPVSGPRHPASYEESAAVAASSTLQAQGQGDVEGDAEDEDDEAHNDPSETVGASFRDSGVGTSLEEKESAHGSNVGETAGLQRRRSSRRSQDG